MFHISYIVKLRITYGVSQERIGSLVVVKEPCTDRGVWGLPIKLHYPKEVLSASNCTQAVFVEPRMFHLL